MEGQAERESPSHYLQTIRGKLKIVQMVCTMLTFAISLASSWSHYGGGWVHFTGIICFIKVTIWFILHLTNFISRISFNYISELISYCIMTIFLLISGIMAASRAQWFHMPTHRATIGACSFFAFASAITCGIDVVLQYREFRKFSTTTTVEPTSTSQSTVTLIF